MPQQTVGDVQKQLARYKKTSPFHILTQTEPSFEYDIKNISSTSEQQIQHLFDDGEKQPPERVIMTIALRPRVQKRKPKKNEHAL
jgi:hypothetical protein